MTDYQFQGKPDEWLLVELHWWQRSAKVARSESRRDYYQQLINNVQTEIDRRSSQ